MRCGYKGDEMDVPCSGDDRTSTLLCRDCMYVIMEAADTQHDQGDGMEWDSNPVFQCGDGSFHDVGDAHTGLVAGKWYFWDEVWAYTHGPFDTKEVCDRACTEYAETL